MKKIIKPLVIASSFLVLGGVNSVANAYDDSRYFGVGLSKADVKLDVYGTSGTFSTNMLNLKYRQNLHENFAVEGTFGLGITDDSKSALVYDKYSGKTFDGKLTIKPKVALGFFGVGKLPINEQFEVYGKLGLQYMSADMDMDAKPTDGSPSVSTSISESKTKFAYGAGANFFFNKTQGLNFELTGFEVDSGIDVTTMSLNYLHKF